jgi:hypothetical protein
VTALTIGELIFKGTHNSYSCRRARPLCMNHPPDQQIDDFGVWSLELDFSLEPRHGAPIPVVGHDRPGHGACWANDLVDYLQIVFRARALQFRPVFICLDVKDWKRSLLQPWRAPVDSGFAVEDKWQAGLQAMRTACSDRLVILEDWLAENGRWPLPLELAGKVVLYEPNKRSDAGEPVGLRGTHASHCVTPQLVEAAIETGKPLEKDGAACEGGARALRIDQYQADWTFAYGVPPNPLVVDAEALTTTLVHDAEGKRWRCDGDVSHGQRVAEQGTFRFPYRTLEQAVQRARGVTTATHGRPDERRAGRGWTVLLKSGALPAGGRVTDFPLTILPWTAPLAAPPST